MESPLLDSLPPEVVYRRVPLPDEENAYPLWRAAAAISEKSTYRYTDDGDGKRKLPFGSPPALDAARRHLAECRAALELFDAGLARNKLQVPPSGKTYDPLDYSWPRSLFHLTRLRGRVAAADGDLPRAIESFTACQRFGDLLSDGDGNTLHYVFGSAVREGAACDLRDCATQFSCDEATLAAAAEALQASLDSPDGYAAALRVMLCDEFLPHLERMPETDSLEDLVAALIAHFYDLGPPDAKPDAEAEANWGEYRQAAMEVLLDGHPRLFDKRDTARLLGEEVARRIAIAQHPWTARSRTWVRDLWRNATARLGVYRPVEDWPLALMPSFTSRSLRRLRGKSCRRYLPAWLLAEARLPSFARLKRQRRRLLAVENPIGRMIASSATIVSVVSHHDVARRVALLSVVLHRHAVRHARLPNSLGDLISGGLLREVPLDPYCGRPLRYCPRRRIVWSVGMDGRDNGGRQGSALQKGTDMVFSVGV